MSKARDLEREVFGGSESELSSDEDEEPQVPAARHPISTVHPSALHDDLDLDQESSAGRSDSQDEYVQQKKPAAAAAAAAVVGKATKKKVRRKRPQPEGPAGESVRTAKKRKRKQPVEIDLSELPPEQANKIRLDMKIDEILLRSKKPSRPRKKKSAASSEVLDSFADDEVARLRETMNNAADEDVRANQEKMPALAKLRMLREVVDTLRKASLAQSIIDNNLLDAVRRFLEPLPDRSLPALSIQRELFASLRKMEWIDSPALKESGLGRIVLFYTKCKRVEKDVGKVAKELVDGWSRPIVGRSKEFRDRVVPVVSEGGGGGGAAGRAGEKLASILARAKEEENRPGARKVRKNAVSIPQRELGTYVVAPVDGLARDGAGGGGTQGAGGAVGMAGSVKRSVEMDVERRRKNAERLRSLTRKVAASGAAGAGGR